MFQRVTKTRKYVLLDDGTMDTVVGVICNCGCQWEERFSATGDYRDKKTGEMVNFTGLINDWLDDEPCLDCGE